MRNFEKTTKQRRAHLDEILSHKPTTDIIERIKEATPTRGVLVNIEITPDIARDILTLNTDNRPPDYVLIKNYIEMMLNDKWFFIGEVIRISKTFKLLDTQQRLMAIIESGISQIMHIQTGIEDEAFGVIDTGRTRSGADALAIAGFRNVNVLSAAIKQEIYFKQQQMTTARVFRNWIKPWQLIEWTKNKNSLKQMENCVDYAITYLHPKGKFLSQTSWAFLLYTLSSIRGAKQQATNFCTLVASGENVSLGNETSVIYLLREQIQSIQAEKYVGSKISTDLKIRYFFTAWNHYRNGEILKKLTIDRKITKLPLPI